MNTKKATLLCDCVAKVNCDICIRATCCPCWLYGTNWVYHDDPLALLNTKIKNPDCTPVVKGDCTSGYYCDNVPCNKAIGPCLLFATGMAIDGYTGMPVCEPTLVYLQQREVFKDMDTGCCCQYHDKPRSNCSCLESFLCTPCKLGQVGLHYKKKRQEMSIVPNSNSTNTTQAPYMRMHMPM